MLSVGATKKEFGTGNNLDYRKMLFDVRYLALISMGLISLMSIDVY